MKYFRNPKTAEELKKQYKDLAMKNHPDHGGDTETMKAINAEYTELFERLKNIHTAQDGGTYEAREENATTETPDEFIEILNILFGIPGIDIELCGSWLWITGDTRKNKDALKEAGCKWSSKKTAWYYHNEGYHKKSKKSFTMDEIRDFYGSEKIMNNYRRHTALEATPV